ncbi:ABC transporter ATP-binding protein [Leptolyngbya sp. FACHB-261]|uniref:ABC transporter ATP-binding protein n=1 Tax=Leptolyngbya sp. FACHB-261 TaxID=2692806 RepID=UPI00168950FA|nr:ABC transporter ATP-binding protein [Leptolyngbya sp. FACHB-261]MBD2103104.1 ABC transporter ATP-binding protein [Leptolyngbya sp. FACHB-261]
MQLRAHSLSKRYGTSEVVRDINLVLEPGQVLGLLGPNGAGKSTTLGMLYGMVIPSSGFVRLGNWDVQTQGPQARQHMGIVTQDDNLDPDFSVLDNLIYFARHYRLTGLPARRRAAEVLHLVGLEGREQSRVEELSGGLKRRLVLARALLNQPEIVFLDEPTTGLDPDARQDFWKLVTQLKLSGCGLLLTTHYMDEAERLCDHLMLVQQGEVVDQGTPQELIDRIIGREVVEVEGVSIELLKQLAEAAGSWSRPFSNGYLIVLPERNAQALLNQIDQEQPTRLNRRRANLEDVFLRLTGALL